MTAFRYWYEAHCEITHCRSFSYFCFIDNARPLRNFLINDELDIEMIVRMEWPTYFNLIENIGVLGNI